MTSVPLILAEFALGGIDVGVIAVYLAIVVWIGVASRRSHPGRREEFLLAGRSMPVVAVAISVLATMQSAATFVGGPQESYAGDLTYLATNLATLIAVIIVATRFLPAFYRARVTTVYEFLGHTFGNDAQRCGSMLFLMGRLLASGARLYIIAIPFSLFAFGSINAEVMMVSIIIIATIAMTYTMIGGVRAVIWTDVLQASVYIVAVIAALALLLQKIPLDIGTVTEALAHDDKIRIIEWNPTNVYSIWGVLTGWTLFMIAALGTDQDLTQRMLTCSSPKRSATSLIVSTIMSWPVVMLFLLLGSLLYIYYQRTDLMGDAAPAYAINDSRKVFIEFIRMEIPAGLRGLMLAGLFAAAMSSLDSALNAMASTVVADFYRPWRRSRGSRGAVAHERDVAVARMSIAVFAALLAGVACVCVRMYDAERDTLISFALGIMIFAYGGLLGVFLTALFTSRGNNHSAVAGMLAGFIAVVAMRPHLWATWAERFLNTDLGETPAIALPWQMCVATGVSFGICALGKRPTMRRRTAV
ncbi:MAG: sodium/solute symporter [Planctomycetota bacterium]